MARVDADRNLLLGILAQQLDFVTRDNLFAAMNAWIIRKDTPLGALLVERGDLAPSRRDMLDALVDEHVRAHGGEPARSLQALSSVGPVAEDLGRLSDADIQASVAHLRSRGTFERPADPFETRPPASLGAPTSWNGRFRVVRPHAHGGLGVVSVALDDELDREVAFKEIKDEKADDRGSRARFVLEAEITGKLEHPGIIPIYGLGHDPAGRPFYAMRFIRGDSLADAINRYHDPSGPYVNPAKRALQLRELLGRFLDVCDAIAYAHSRGVLHRDLKPGNVMLGPFGETLVVDWGMALPLERVPDGQESTEGAVKPTKTDSASLPREQGSVVGTPAYMPPEQAEGAINRLGPRSDVYGLGAILYDLLTGKGPIEGTSLEEILNRVGRGEVKPPRQVRPEIPVPLEAVCLKALSVRPEDRYPTPRALAADIKAWLADEPVSVRRDPFRERASRWAKRNRSMVTAAVAALMVGLIGLCAVAAVQTKARIALSVANSKLNTANKDLAEQRVRAEDREAQAREAEKQAAQSRDAAQASEKRAVASRAEAEKNYELAATQATLALNTIQDLVERVSTGLNHPNLFDLKTEIIQKALERVDAVANIFQGSINKEVATFAALFELGKIYRQTGKIEKAAKIFRQCLDIARARIVIKKGSDLARQNLVNVLGELADCSIEHDRDLKAAVAYDREALNILQDIFDHPMREDRVIDRDVTLNNLGYYHYRIGTSLLMVGELVRSLEEYRQAYIVHVDLLAAARNDPELIRTAALDALTLGNGSYLLGRRQAAEDYFRQSLDLIEQFDRVRKGAADARALLASYRSVVGLYRFRVGQREAARREYQSARDLLVVLATADPQNIYYRSELVELLGRLGRLEETAQQPGAARSAFEEAYRLAEENYRVDEKNDLRRMALLKLLPRVGQVERALEMAERMAAGPKVDPELWVELACCYAQCARSLPAAKAEVARDCQTKAVDAVRAAIRGGFRDKIALEIEPDLDPLRPRPDFQAVLREMPAAS